MLSHFFDQQYPDNEIKTWSFSLAGTGCSIMAFGTTGYQSSFFDVPETDVEKAKVQNTIFQKIYLIADILLTKIKFLASSFLLLLAPVV